MCFLMLCDIVYNTLNPQSLSVSYCSKTEIPFDIEWNLNSTKIQLNYI